MNSGLHEFQKSSAIAFHIEFAVCTFQASKIGYPKKTAGLGHQTKTLPNKISGHTQQTPQSAMHCSMRSEGPGQSPPPRGPSSRKAGLGSKDVKLRSLHVPLNHAQLWGAGRSRHLERFVTSPASLQSSPIGCLWVSSRWVSCWCSYRLQPVDYPKMGFLPASPCSMPALKNEADPVVSLPSQRQWGRGGPRALNKPVRVDLFSFSLSFTLSLI